jgi:hypothetical protein
MLRHSCLPILLTALAFGALFGVLARAQAFDFSRPAETGKRKLVFPGERSVGTLLLLPPHKSIRTAFEQISGAKGVVEVNIPKNNLLIFEPNQQVFLHPAFLDIASVGAVDALKISFLSMDTKEDTLCDELLKHLSRFSNVSILCVADSDTTDSGLAAALHFPHLKELITTHTNVRGLFLKNTGSLCGVRTMDLGDCALDRDSYKYLSALKTLTSICLAKDNLDSSKLSEVVACPNLTDLDISGNSKIDDNCIKTILQFKKLQSLNLARTSITLQGLKLLSPLKLKKIWLPRSSYKDSENAMLTSMFGAAIMAHSSSAKRQKDLEMILAPTGKVRGTH